MRLSICLILSTFTLAAVGPVQAHLADEGRWVVTRVFIDPALDNAEQRYFTNDPRFVGRFVDVRPERVAIDGDIPCTQVRRTVSRGTLAGLLKAKLYRRSPSQRRHPTPVDMHVAGALKGPVDIVRYDCVAPDTGRPGGIPGHIWSGVSGFPLASPHRGLLWETEVILELSPAAQAQPPRPSFDCKRARSIAETTICRDPALANWDRSVAAAFVLLRDGGGPDRSEPVDDPAALLDSQRQWLAVRETCSANRECLEDRMSERTDALMRRQFDRGS